MEWFGWLTKGHYQLTLLDKLIGLAELTVLVLIGCAIGLYFERRKKK